MSKPINPIFYVYAYLDPRKPGYYVFGNYIFEHEPFYVGKGNSKRAYKHLYEFTGNRHLYNKIKKIRKEYDCKPIIIKVNEMITEEEAFEIEKELICVIGRWDKKLGTLCNHTDGGEGTYGYHHTESARVKIGASHKGKLVSEETRMKRSKTLKGHSISKEQIQKQKSTWLKKRLERESKKQPLPVKQPKWLITYPNGSTVKVSNLKKFCENNGLIKQGLHNLARGNGKTYKGFRCEKIDSTSIIS